MIFQDVLVKKPGRSLFNLSHERKFSADWAYLYPIMCTEMVPGDTFKVTTEVFVRTAPLVAPIMHRVNVKLNYFFVPCRLLWNEWPDFITGINQKGTYNPSLPDAEQSYFVQKIPPFFELTSGYAYPEHFKDGSLADFLGFPTVRPNQSIAGTTQVQLLPFKAYQKIYNDWFRNQNVEAEHVIGEGDTGKVTNVGSLFLMRKRMYEKDYYTSALPFAQRGTPVDIPTAGVTFDSKGKPTKIVDASDNSQLPSSFTTGQNVKAYYDINGDGYSSLNTANQSTDVDLAIDNSSQLKVNMGTINDLRIATKLQRWLEVNARVGGRYIEQILGHFAIHSSDARLQRAEYLGGWSSPVLVEDVPQTSMTIENSGTPQANLAGKGTTYNNGKPIKCFAEEHGFFIGILSILPRTTYQDTLPKMFQRVYKEDYYFPEFANLGEQEVNKAEVYYNLADSNQQSKARFGFQERYCEYKYIPSTVHGEFKGALQFWHVGRTFNTQPSLNQSFVTAQPRTNMFAVESTANHFYINLINHVKALRPMPKQAIPTL